MAIASQAIPVFAGEPMVSSKQIVAPPPPAPVSYFRGNEFVIGAFATYVTGTNGGGSVTRRTFVDDETVTLSSSGSPYRDGAEAWISLISYLGNMQVSGSKVRAWNSRPNL
jgi:hypothetical protein